MVWFFLLSAGLLLNFSHATPARLRHAREFQRLYMHLIDRAARRTHRPVRETLERVAERSAVINRYARITGDSVSWVVRTLLRHRREMAPTVFIDIMNRFIDAQVLDPDRGLASPAGPPAPVLRKLADIVASLRHGL